MTRIKPIRIVKRFRADPQRVFDAWLDPSLAREWLFATAMRPMTEVVIDARVGGAFRFAERHTGVWIEYRGWYEQIEPHFRLVFRLMDAAGAYRPSRITVEIASHKRGCVLQLCHEQVPPQGLRETQTRWMGMLYGLNEMLALRAIPGRIDTTRGDKHEIPMPGLS